MKSASSENWRRSAKEVIIIAIITLIPLICKAGYYYFQLQNTKSHISFVNAIIAYVIGGDLLFFSIANFAAVFWLSSQDFIDRFEERIYFILVSIVGLSVCTFLVGFNPTFKGIPPDVLRIISMTSFCVSIFMNIILLVFESYSGIDLSSSASAEENNTTERLRDRRRL